MSYQETPGYKPAFTLSGRSVSVYKNSICKETMHMSASKVTWVVVRTVSETEPGGSVRLHTDWPCSGDPRGGDGALPLPPRGVLGHSPAAAPQLIPLVSPLTATAVPHGAPQAGRGQSRCPHPSTLFLRYPPSPWYSEHTRPGWEEGHTGEQPPVAPPEGQKLLGLVSTVTVLRWGSFALPGTRRPARERGARSRRAWQPWPGHSHARSRDQRQRGLSLRGRRGGRQALWSTEEAGSLLASCSPPPSIAAWGTGPGRRGAGPTAPSWHCALRGAQPLCRRHLSGPLRSQRLWSLPRQ